MGGEVTTRRDDFILEKMYFRKDWIFHSLLEKGMDSHDGHFVYVVAFASYSMDIYMYTHGEL